MLAARLPAFVTLALSVSSQLAAAPAAHGAVRILSPQDGARFSAALCPSPPCTARVIVTVEVDIAATVETVHLREEEIGGTGSHPDRALCEPGDPVEGGRSCPGTRPFAIEGLALLEVGTHRLTAIATTTTGAQESASIIVLVDPDGTPSPGPVSLLEVTPGQGEPALEVREPGFEFSEGLFTTPSQVEIIGLNLDAATNPFIEVYLAPKPPSEPVLAPGSALPVHEWCLHPVHVVERSPLEGGGSKIVVEMPQLPESAPTICGFTPGPESSIFAKDWRWVVRDGWRRDERLHEWWAIPSPRLDGAEGAPPFEVVKPRYPLIDGFGFPNHKTDASYQEFLTVYGDNAYVCLDCLPGLGCACIVKVPDPLYHILWLPIYQAAVDSTGGSCNGMSATSLLMAREELQTEAFEPDVQFPFGFDDPGPGSIRFTDAGGNLVIQGVPQYENSNFCTPFCSPPKPANLWAHIRMNHGVQISREFLAVLLATVGEGVLDVDRDLSVSVFDGIPNITLERLREDSLGYVLCFFQPGNGHCVTPYRVEGNRIWIYDNNAPGVADTRYIDIIDGDYDYPERDADPNHGNAIVAFPIEIWKRGRHLLGLSDLIMSFGDVEFASSITVGSADMLLTNDGGGRWGWEPDGTLTESMRGALSVPPLGPPDEDVRQIPLLLAMNQPAPRVQINADGGPYRYHAAQGGHFLQLEAADAQAGDEDVLQLGYEAGRLASFEFTPERAARHLVPRVGLEIDPHERVVVHWLGLEVPAGSTAAFGAERAERAVRYRNATGAPTHHLLVLDHASGSGAVHGRSLYGPFEVPPGANHRVVMRDWPDVTEVVSELDFDGDGTADRSDSVAGRAAAPPTALDRTANLALEKLVAPDLVALGESLVYRVAVSNAGPEAASGVLLIDALPPFAEVSSVETTRGSCGHEAAGIHCALGELPVGEVARIEYAVKVGQPGTLANGATVFGNEQDPDWTNNTAVTSVRAPLRIDIMPGDPLNSVNPSSNGVTPVAILGELGFDVTAVDPSTLTFGPARAPTAHAGCGHVEDVNEDGVPDLVSHHAMRATGLVQGDVMGCLVARTVDGRALEGCDALRTVPTKPKPGSS